MQHVNRLSLLVLAIVSTTAMPAIACPPPWWHRLPQVSVSVDLNYIPTDTAMDLVSYYDRMSGLEFVSWGLLAASALAVVALIVERSVHFRRLTTQTRRFMYAANEALAAGRTSDIPWLAACYPLSPVASLVAAGLVQSDTGEYQASSASREIAASFKTAEVARGLNLLGAIGMTTPIIGSAVALVGLIYCFRTKSRVPLDPAILHLWIADWLGCLVAALIVASVATYAHRLLAAKANYALMQMDRLSLAIISRVTDPDERHAVQRLVITEPPTRGMKTLDTRPIRN